MIRGTDSVTKRFEPALALAGFVALGTAAGAADPGSGFVEALTRESLSVEERMRLRCPDSAAPGPFAAPVGVDPSPDMVLWVTFTDGDDLVRLSAGELGADLGAGNDTALIFDMDAGANLTAGSGADTVLLCSMEDLHVTIELGGADGTRPDSDVDVLIIEPGIFTTVPRGMQRQVLITGAEKALDRLVIHTPAGLLDTRRVSEVGDVLRIGDVVFQSLTLFSPEQAIKFETDEAVILRPHTE